MERNMRSSERSVDRLGGLPAKIGMQLREARRSANIRQSDLAMRMEAPVTAVSRVENGRALPSIEFIERYARAVGVPLQVTFGSRGLADADVRRERAKGAIVEAPDRANWNTGIPRKALATVMDERTLRDPTASYLRVLEESIPDLGASVLLGVRFKKALAFAGACFEVIDWGRVRAVLAEMAGEARGAAMRSLHLKVVRRVPEVIAAAAGRPGGA